MGHCRPNCGACCDPVVLPYRMREIEQSVVGFGELSGDIAFILEHFTEIPRGEGLRRSGYFDQGGSTYTIEHGERVERLSWFFECDQFNAETKECEAYDSRPSFCRDYPWYGQPPVGNKTIPGCCTYLEDVGEVPVDPPSRRRVAAR